MFRKAIVLLIIAFFCFISVPAFAASSTDEAVLGADRFSVQSDGDLVPNADNSYDIGSSSAQVADIYYNGTLIAGTSAIQKVRYEKATTSDTLTTADSGKVIVYVATTYGTAGEFDLPSATVGLEYIITAGNASDITVDPNGTEVIRYSTCTTGDSISANATTADSVHLVCYEAGKWAVQSMVGTWADAN